MEKEMIQRIWALLTEATPLIGDCGRLCGAACCQADEDDQGGVYLFPGESELIKGADWAKIEATDALGGAEMLECIGRCERQLRPIGCRIFPLTTVRLKSGCWGARFDCRANAMCPLAQHDIRGLSSGFIDAVVEAANLIATDPEGERFLRHWAKLERSYSDEGQLF